MTIQQHGKALGTQVVFTLRSSDEKQVRLTLTHIQNFLHEFEDRLSRFLVGSELARHNQVAGRWSPASSEFIAFARLSNHMQDMSEGLYNPFVLPDLQRSGYLRSFVGSHGTDDVLDMRERRADYQSARIGIRGSMVRIPRGTALDTGGLGKGYALDIIAELVEQDGIVDYWISLGGDIIGRGMEDDGKPWLVTLDMIESVPTVELDQYSRTAVATSSVRKRRGKGWHHLIDPRTGAPSDSPVQTASVVAATGAEADIMAKCLLLAGENAAEFWKRHETIEAYIQTAS